MTTKFSLNKGKKNKQWTHSTPLKVPNQYRSHMTFSYKIQANTFTWPDTSFCARKVTLMCQSKESNTSALGRIVINISVHLVLIYTSVFIDGLLVLALSFMVHRSNYMLMQFSMLSSENLFWFTIWTRPHQMREYLLRYTGTGRNLKNHTISIPPF